MRNYTLLDIDLRLFDGAAGGAAAGGEGTPGDGAASQVNESALPKAETKGRHGSSRRGRTGEYDNVVFGKQGDDPDAGTAGSDAGSDGEGNPSGVSTTSNTLEERRKAFDELIDGEYKDMFTERMQQVINRRFKETKGLEESLSAQKPILDMLMQRYGIADGDMGKLQTAIEEDTGYWEEAAEEAGLTVEQYKAMQKLERENAEFKAMRQRQLGEQAAQQQLATWYKDAEVVKETYPGFDLRTEIADQQFRGLLRAGIPMQQAYELVHMEEIKASAAKVAAQTAGEQMAARMKSKASRPKENGTSTQSAVIVKNDVSKLTREDRAEIARRAQRGESIKF